MAGGRAPCACGSRNIDVKTGSIIPILLRLQGLPSHGQYEMLWNFWPFLAMLWSSTVALFLTCILSKCIVAEPECIPVILGSPKFSDCNALLFGDGNPSSPWMFGIAAIDEYAHAFTIPRAERAHESDSEWARRVQISKIWANCQYPYRP